ncbi:MAG TPA: hypothetical protein VF800_10245 [Telluria sp.]|jgi:hypothetical protein
MALLEIGARDAQVFHQRKQGRRDGLAGAERIEQAPLDDRHAQLGKAAQGDRGGGARRSGAEDDDVIVIPGARAVRVSAVRVSGGWCGHGRA